MVPYVPPLGARGVREGPTRTAVSSVPAVDVIEKPIPSVSQPSGDADMLIFTDDSVFAVGVVLHPQVVGKLTVAVEASALVRQNDHRRVELDLGGLVPGGRTVSAGDDRPAPPRDLLAVGPPVTSIAHLLIGELLLPRPVTSKNLDSTQHASDPDASNHYLVRAFGGDVEDDSVEAVVGSVRRNQCVEGIDDLLPPRALPIGPSNPLPYDA